ncbi:MAG: glycosyltransferase family 2 protein [Bacteroidota bacterium]
MRVTIITAVLNNVSYIQECMTSVSEQGHMDLEHIIVDGGSNDGTQDVVETHKTHHTRFVSEADLGVYDALNKGISMATGELIGVLGADDLLADDTVISHMVEYVEKYHCDAVYGHLNFVSRNNKGKIVRKWRSSQYSPGSLEKGWMPPHPAFYVKKSVLTGIVYSQGFGSCGDYDFLLRILYRNRIKAIFVNKLVVCMRTGGMSNGSVSNRIGALINDYKILVHHRIPNPLLVVFMKKIVKLKQYC